MAKKYSCIEPEICEQAVIFARVSSERQEQGASIDAQKETIYDYCRKKNLNIIKEFIITESTMRGDRTQYKEMLSFVKSCKGKIAIVVNCVDRLQRSYKDTPALDELRKTGKIEVHFLKERLILHKDSNGNDMLFWNLFVLMANSYVLSLSDNVKRSQNYNWSIGKWQSRAPLGYLNKRDENNKAIIVIDEERAPIIKRMFQEYATGTHTLKTLWQMAKEQGLMAKEPVYSKRSANRGKITYISRNKVYDILTNPFYYGVMCVNNKLYKHQYEPIIDKALFDRVQKVLTKNTSQGHQTEYGNLDFAFRGLIKCSTCGCTISPEKHTKKSGKSYVYYKCSHQKSNCMQEMVTEKILLEQLNLEVFNKLSLPKPLIALLKQNVRQKLDEDNNLNASVKRNVTNQLKALKDKEDNLLDFFLENKINESVYNKKKAEIDATRAELEATSAKYEIISDEIRKAIDLVFEITGGISQIIKVATPKKQNQLLNILLEDCKLDGQKLIYRLRAPFDKFVQCDNPKEWINLNTADFNAFAKVAEEAKSINMFQQ